MKVLVIGLGQIGYRHAQSLLSSNETRLTIIEPNQNKYCDDLRNNSIYKGRIVDISAGLDQLSEKQFDIALISTSSSPRLNIAEYILNTIEIKALILEKIVFQRTEHFDRIFDLSNDKGVPVFINLPLRTRSMIPRTGIRRCTIKGGNWGLLCNSVHYIDYLSCVMKCDDWDVISSNLNFISSKRGEDYIEAHGTVVLQNSLGFSLELNSTDADNQGVEWALEYDNESVVLTQSELCDYFDLEKSLSFYQSDITLGLFMDVISGNPSLPTLNQSRVSHEILFQAMDLAGYETEKSCYKIT